MARVRTAVIPVAGLGTRMLPAAKAIPKEMLPVVDRPLIEHTVAEARAAGMERIVLVTGQGGSAVVDHFDRAPELEDALSKAGKTETLEQTNRHADRGGEIISVRQARKLGLGHAVWCAHRVVGDEPFAVMLPDDLILGEPPCLSELVAVHDRLGGNVVSVEEVAAEATSRYGILDVTADDGTVAASQGVVEKPAPEVAPSRLGVVGRYVLDPGVMRALADQPAGAGGEIQLTDAIARTLPQTPLHGVRFSGHRYDCGSKAGFVQAFLAVALEHPDTAAAARAEMARHALKQTVSA
ncbi:UDP-glucose pyrophosphorylase [Limimonas halophila]|uniref:UTP--glucose-1-phosphate uridylyltransferase n=1 Tax=Limimonas halophila TaxID=1082479 RepID=A0A1G7NQZ4_9PROT|nr:UTP--glucose-1-phosphate uridylyltransferase [Limimonas halophila]SDF75719.1 UDP-glucose pyrophosphorylase [Limimonas halophila]